MDQALISVILPYLGVALGLFGLGYGVYQASRFKRILKKYEPLIKKAFSMIGTVGAEAKVNTQVAEEVEGALKEGAFQVLEAKYPELSLLMGWLEENKPEIFEKLTDNPQIAVNLYKKYAPLVTGLMGGKSREKRVMYDV